MRNPIRSVLAVIVACLITVVSIFIVMPIALFRPFGRMVYAIEHWWAGIIVTLMGMHVTVEGLENLDSKKNYIFVCNHQSLMDIPLMMRFTPRQLRIIYKKELHWVPLFGQILVIMRFISIDRKNRDRATKSLKKAAQRIHDGINVVIFADGTRSLDGNLRPFKKGAFVLAINAQVQIVPVVISGTINVIHKLDGLTDFSFGRKVQLVFEKPIPTQGLTIEDRDKLKEQVETVMSEIYAKHRHLSLVTHPKTLARVHDFMKKRSNGGFSDVNPALSGVDSELREEEGVT